MVKVFGECEILSGNKLIARCRNKWTRYFMSSVLMMITTTSKSVTANIDFMKYMACGLGLGATCRVGSDTSTTTQPTMSDLVNKVDVAPSSVARNLVRDESGGLYIAEFSFIWDAGVLPDTTIGEFGVYLTTDDDSWASPALDISVGSYSTAAGKIRFYVANNPALRLAARVASADGSFGAFYHYGSVDPLTFKWRFQVLVV